MKIHISGIRWDTDGTPQDDIALPSEVNADTQVDPVGDEDAIANWLSDKFGWTVLSFSCDPPLA